MKLVFKGIVARGDEYRCSCDEPNGSIYIGNDDVISKISECQFNKDVTIAIADSRFSGELSVELGWGYSEYTPMDSDALKVGKHDLIEILERHIGEEITMWASDEPVNVLEDCK